MNKPSIHTLLQNFESDQVQRQLPDFGPGDTVVVNVKVKEGNRERVQAYEGVVIAKKNGGLNSAFTVRKISHGYGVERVFQTHSAIIDSVMPVLSAMGTTVLRTGAVGSGQAMKALNNLVSAGGFLIGIEALLIGQRFGLDPAVMIDVLNAATGMNNSTQKKFRQFVLSRKFDAGFTMGLLVKDLSIALQVGRETDTPAPLSALTRELAAAAQAMFGSDADHTEMAKLCERLAGTQLGGR